MMETFKAYRIDKTDDGIAGGFEQLGLDDLTPGEVVIRAEYSGINYKDALAATGAGRILKQYPLNGGIDVAGIVGLRVSARELRQRRVLTVVAQRVMAVGHRHSACEQESA